MLLLPSTLGCLWTLAQKFVSLLNCKNILRNEVSVMFAAAISSTNVLHVLTLVIPSLCVKIELYITLQKVQWGVGSLNSRVFF